jgi:hypothetical protein
MRKFFIVYLFLLVIFNSSIKAQYINYCHLEEKNILSGLTYHRVDSLFNKPFLYFAGIEGSINLDNNRLNIVNLLNKFGGKFILGKSYNKLIFSNGLSFNLTNNSYYLDKFYILTYRNSIAYGLFKEKIYGSIRIDSEVPLFNYYKFNDNYSNALIYNNYPQSGTKIVNNYSLGAGVLLGITVRKKLDAYINYSQRLNRFRSFDFVSNPDFSFNFSKLSIGFNYRF